MNIRCKDVSMETLRATTTKGTVTLKQSVKYLPTRYLSELGVREGKAFNIPSKVAVLRPATKRTNHEELLVELWVAPKLVRGMTADRHCFERF